MKILKIVLVLCVAFIGLILFLGSTMSATDSAKFTAQKIVSKSLKDPDSAKFSDEFTILQPKNNDGLTLLSACGYVNGKNSFGALAGNTRYVVTFNLTEKDEINFISVSIDDGKTDATLDTKDKAQKESVFDQVYWNTNCVDGNHPKHFTGTTW